MMCLLGSDELGKSLLLFIYVLNFICDLASSPMLVDALAEVIASIIREGIYAR